MNKLASYNYDILDYILAGDFEKIGKVVKPLSDTAKTANVPDFEETQDMPDTHFALITYHPGQGEIKKYAKYDPASTELSIAFLAERYKELPDEIVKTAATNLKKASLAYGVEFPEELEEFVKKSKYINPMVNITAIDEYAFNQKLAWADGDDEDKVSKYALPEEKKYPISDKEEIEKAAEYFNTYVDELPPEKALQYASNVKKASQAYDVDIKGTKLEKFANLSISDTNEDIALHIKQRKGFIPTTKEAAHEAYDELEKNASTLTPGDLSRQLTELDIENKIDHHWGHGIANPAVASFKEKRAEAAPEVSLSQLRRIPSAELTALVGTEAVDDLTGEEGELVYDTLPRPIKKEVKRLAENS